MANEKGADVAVGEWTVRSLTDARGAYNGVRWWAQRAQKAFAAFGAAGVLAFQERPDKTKEDERAMSLLAVAKRIAETFGEFGAAECRIGRELALADAYRGVGAASPVLLVDGVEKDRLVHFAKAVCAAADEDGAVVWSAEGGEMWWVEKNKGAERAAPLIRSLTLLQWMGPRAWANKAEERQVPDRVEEVLRSGHHAWFRVATGEGVPTSRCWMVFNAPGEWAYWRQFGVTRVLDICPDGCRGYWSADGKQWWKVEACAPRGKAVRVDNAKAAYRAACGEMPWEVPFFDRSDKNRERLERMYAYVMDVLARRGMDAATLARRLERAATAVGFNRWANRGMLYGGRFEWRKGETW